MRHSPRNPKAGFTLIELSIVLVIIGLIVGGVLVGRNLIAASELSAAISQIQKYNSSTNAFRDKYGALPGDIKDPDATKFGFIARGTSGPARGDGNGIISGINGATFVCPICQTGETSVFWVDLSTARLIDGNFSTATFANASTAISATTTPNLNNYFPTSKLGQSNYVVVTSGGLSGFINTIGDAQNYFSITGISQLTAVGSSYQVNAVMGITVAQANAMDTKMDDGRPQLGNVLAIGPWLNSNCNAGQGYCTMGYSTYQTAGSSSTCYDNSTSSTGTPGVMNNEQHYSLEINGGNNVNCVLSFKFQ